MEFLTRGEAETEGDRIFLEKVIGVYQFAIREIRECRRDEFYFYRTAIQFGGDSGLFAFPFTYLGDTEAGICRSYQWNSGGNESFDCPASCGYTVQKWRRRGAWRPVLSFDLKPINEEYRTTRFHLYDTLMKQTKMTQEEWVKSYDPERPHPYLLPFLPETWCTLTHPCLNGQYSAFCAVGPVTIPIAAVSGICLWAILKTGGFGPWICLGMTLLLAVPNTAWLIGCTVFLWRSCPPGRRFWGRSGRISGEQTIKTGSRPSTSSCIFLCAARIKPVICRIVCDKRR